MGCDGRPYNLVWICCLTVCALNLSPLVSYFSATELKSLRVAVSSFLEMMALATDTIAQFQLSEHA